MGPSSVARLGTPVNARVAPAFSQAKHQSNTPSRATTAWSHNNSATASQACQDAATRPATLAPHTTRAAATQVAQQAALTWPPAVSVSVPAVSRRLLGRGAYVLVFNSSGQLFVSQRSLSKDCYPGCLDVTVSGVVNVVSNT